MERVQDRMVCGLKTVIKSNRSSELLMLLRLYAENMSIL